MKKLALFGICVALLVSIVPIGCIPVAAEDYEVKVVVHNPTSALVYREIPDFEDGAGITAAVLWYGYAAVDLGEIMVLQSEWETDGEPLTRVVRDTATGRLIYREIPDFKDGYGIINAMLFCDYTDNSTLEEVYVPISAWDSELALRLSENLPHSQHIGKLVDVDVSRAKPATVRRWYKGNTYDEKCLVSQSVVDMWIADTLNINDWVIVSYIDEIPDTEEINICIVVDKVYPSWQ